MIGNIQKYSYQIICGNKYGKMIPTLNNYLKFFLSTTSSIVVSGFHLVVVGSVLHQVSSMLKVVMKG